MNEEMSKQAMKEKQPWGKRLFAFLLAMILLVQVVPTEVFAAWDGSGNSGDTSTTPITGAYLIYSGYGNAWNKSNPTSFVTEINCFSPALFTFDSYGDIINKNLEEQWK